MKEGDQNKTFKHPPPRLSICCLLCMSMCAIEKKKDPDRTGPFLVPGHVLWPLMYPVEKPLFSRWRFRPVSNPWVFFFFHPFLLQYKRETMEMIISSHEVFPLLLERASRSSGQLEFRNLFLSGLWVAQGQRVNSLTGSPPPTLLHSVHTLSL